MNRVERRLRVEIEAALEEGFALSVGCIGSDHFSMLCAIGAVVRDLRINNNTQRLYTVAAVRLGIPERDVWSITNGFDGDDNPGNEYRSIGARLRRAYLVLE